MSHRYRCIICDFTTTRAAAMEHHRQTHQLTEIAMQDGHIVTSVDLLAAHIDELLAERQQRPDDGEATP